MGAGRGSKVLLNGSEGPAGDQDGQLALDPGAAMGADQVVALDQLALGQEPLGVLLLPQHHLDHLLSQPSHV